jgi:hypothetical protein
MHTASAHAAQNFRVSNFNLDYEIDGDTGFAQRFCLRDGARETVDDEALCAIRLGDALFDQFDDDVIRRTA